MLMSTQSFENRLEELKREVEQFSDEFSPQQVEETALRLERFNFTPPIITPVKTFVRLRKETLLEEIERIVNLDEAEACALAPGNQEKCEDLRLQHITVIVFHFKKLLELRRGNSEEWDEIDELYVHD